MAKYIDADMAIEKLSCINPTEPTIWYSDAVEAINNTPAADVIKSPFTFIRCRVCDHYDWHNHRCKYFNHGVDEDGFCSWAKITFAEE